MSVCCYEVKHKFTNKWAVLMCFNYTNYRYPRKYFNSYEDLSIAIDKVKQAIKDRRNGIEVKMKVVSWGVDFHWRMFNPNKPRNQFPNKRFMENHIIF